MIAATCGHEKAINGRPALKCTLPAGHQGPHGIAVPGLTPFVRWFRG